MHLFVENLTNVDFSYLDSERGMVGETWLANIILEGTLDAQGMVCDFGIVKKTVRQWLDTTIDHCLVVAAGAPELQIKKGETIDICWDYTANNSDKKTLQCCSPKQAITLIEGHSVTPSSVAAWCIKQLRTLLPETIHQITLTFTPEEIEHHSYHYSHGLKKHNGNCQRIAHGHRSTIEIFQDGQRNHSLEALWCKQWQDIYLGSREDLQTQYVQGGQNYYHFTYQAQQGEFSLSLPAADCYLLETDTTVEFIAQHIADTLKQQHPAHRFTVRAFEGAGKGAMALSPPP